MSILPESLDALIEAFGALPGVGPRTAERYAYHLLKTEATQNSHLGEAIANIKSQVDYCKVTFALIEKGREISELYSDPSRDKTLVAVVADPFDIVALEKTGGFKGTYHVLGGLISPIDGVSPGDLHIAELIARVKNDKVAELILATNASVEGESTALFIQRELSDIKVKITRLARGLPVGVDLEYADQITLSRALEGRTLL